jgi:hypothetical protein
MGMVSFSLNAAISSLYAAISESSTALKFPRKFPQAPLFSQESQPT